MAESSFRAGGIISGLDTNSIVEQFTALQSRPLTTLRTKQQAFRTQISSLADLSSRLKSLKDSVDSLAKNGVAGAKTTSTNTAFSATPGSSAVAGTYSVEVSTLATAARSASAAFGSSDTLGAGKVTIHVDGTDYDVATTAGQKLSDLAQGIKDAGVPVSAVVLNDGTNDYLSITRKETGNTIGKAADYALSIDDLTTGGKALGFTTTNATNASFKVNDIAFTRTTNSVTDVVPGTTLTLKAKTTSAETLTIDNDVDATAANVQKFVDAYNNLARGLSVQLKPAAGADRSLSLTGDASVRRLQSDLQQLLTNDNGATGGVRSVADLGIKIERDGSLSLDKAKLKSAVDNNSSAVNNVFAKATTGISAVVTAMSDRYTNIVDGAFTVRTKGINDNIKSLDRQADSMQLRIDTYKQNLIDQFAAMEKVVSGLKATGSFLSNF